MITLHAPDAAEIPPLRARRAAFCRKRGLACEDDSLPADYIFARALALATAHPEAADWLTPRLVIDHAIGAVVGSCLFKYPPRIPPGEIEIAYGIAAAYRNQGYATATVRELLLEAWTDPAIRRVLATVRPENHPSLRVLAKFPFHPDGTESDPDLGPLLRFIHPRPGA